MSHFKHAIRWLVNGLTVFLLIILIMVIYGKCVLMFTDNKYPNYFGYTLFEVASGSMEPTLYTHDVILIKITNDKLKQDDIIAFNNENAIITHRIIFIDGNVITVKGDNNNTVDMPINRKQVIGKVVKIFPKFGIWKKVIIEPKILVLIFVTLLLFDFALSYEGNKKEALPKKEKKEKKEKVKKTPSVKQDVKVKKKDIVEAPELLEATRKIDIEEINALLDKQDIVLNKKEKKQLEKEVKNESDIKSTDYTTRLDLNQIRKKINSKLK